MDFSFCMLGSILFGYWGARIIQFILTDLFSNTLTSVILCISLVYMTFYIGKAETATPSAVLQENFIDPFSLDAESSSLSPAASPLLWPLCASCHLIFLPPPALPWSLLTSQQCQLQVPSLCILPLWRLAFSFWAPPWDLSP